MISNREIRKRLGLSQKELAQMAGVSQQTLSAIEHGKYRASSYRVTRKVYDVLKPLVEERAKLEADVKMLVDLLD